MISDEMQVLAIEAALQHGEVIRVRFHGSSMLPTVLPGATVPIEPVAPEDCVRGDLVVVRHDAILVAHRWMGGRPGQWTLQGDAFDHPDPSVDDDQVLGRAAGVVLGRWTFRLPPVAGRWVSSEIVRRLPLLRRSYSQVRMTLRGAMRAAQQTPVIGSARRRLQNWSIERLEPRYLGDVRATLLTHGHRPTRATLATWTRLATSEREAAFIARSCGRVIGYSSVLDERRARGVGRCGYLWVNRWYRSLGIAGALKAAVVAHAREVGYRELVTRARWGSDSMRASERVGFVASRDSGDPAWADLRLVFGA